MKNFEYKGYNCKVQTNRYQNNGRLSVRFVEVGTGDPICSVSSNRPDEFLLDNENTFFVKNYSENEGMKEFLQSSPLFTIVETGTMTGWPVAKLNENLETK